MRKRLCILFLAITVLFAASSPIAAPDRAGTLAWNSLCTCEEGRSSLQPADSLTVLPGYRAEYLVGKDYVSQREWSGNWDMVELVASSESLDSPDAGFPELDFLRDVENKILLFYHSCGLSYAEIGKKLKKKKSYVKSSISEARAKIGAKSSIGRGLK